MLLVPPDSLNSIRAGIAQFGCDSSARSLAFEKRYLSASELRRLRQSPGSPLLTEVLLALGEPLTCWTVDDPGVDEQGYYELLDPSDQRTPGVASAML
jgi:hypothetical protein